MVTLYLIRAVVVYAANGALTYARHGRAEACRVLQLQTGKAETSRLATARGLVTAAMALLLNLSFLLLTFNDAFTVFKGVDMLATVILSRALLGSSERLSPGELACGLLTLCGIVLVAQGLTQPSAAGDAAAGDAAVSVAGVAVAAVAGVLSACSGVSTRVLSARGGAHEGHAPPAMLLSYLLVTMGVCFAAIAIGARASNLDQAPHWRWTNPNPDPDPDPDPNPNPNPNPNPDPNPGPDPNPDPDPDLTLASTRRRTGGGLPLSGRPTRLIGR